MLKQQTVLLPINVEKIPNTPGLHYVATGTVNMSLDGVAKLNFINSEHFHKKEGYFLSHEQLIHLLKKSFQEGADFVEAAWSEEVHQDIDLKYQDKVKSEVFDEFLKSKIEI